MSAKLVEPPYNSVVILESRDKGLPIASVYLHDFWGGWIDLSKTTTPDRWTTWPQIVEHAESKDDHRLMVAWGFRVPEQEESKS